MLHYVLSEEAKTDLEEITEYSFAKYGVEQTLEYIAGLEQAAENLARSLGHFKELTEVHPALRMKKCEKHYIFGIVRANQPFLVIAVFHERMQLMQRLQGRLG